MDNLPVSNIEPLKSELAAPDTKPEVTGSGAKSPKTVTFDEQPTTITDNNVETSSIVAGMKDMAICALQSVDLGPNDAKDKEGKDKTIFQQVVQVNDTAVHFVTNAVQRTQDEAGKYQTTKDIKEKTTEVTKAGANTATQKAQAVTSIAQDKVEKGQVVLESALSEDTNQTMKESVQSARKKTKYNSSQDENVLQGATSTTPDMEPCYEMTPEKVSDQHLQTEQVNRELPVPIDAATDKIDTNPSKQGLHNKPGLCSQASDPADPKGSIIEAGDSSNDSTVHIDIKSSSTVSEILDASAKGFYDQTGSEFPDTNA